jgi:hypothetical protein
VASVSPTRTSTPRLSEAARHLVLPSGITSTAWPSVKAECANLGLSFDPWQNGAGQAILAKREDGIYAAGIGGVVISIPRQVGKTFLIGAIIFALCRMTPGLTVIWTAHQLRTAEETFLAMKAMAAKPKIRPHIKRVVLGSGEEAIEFVNGSRILFGARERGFGLGFAMVDVLVLDEAQRVTEKTMDDLIPTTNQAPNPLIFLMGTPPRPTDAGEVFGRARRDALSGESDDQVYLEFSADSNVNTTGWKSDRNKIDWGQVAKANPSFPKRTPRTAILRMLKHLGEDSFRREGLGVWDDDSPGSRVITPAQWSATGIDEPPPTGVKSFGVAFSFDGSRVSVAGAMKHETGVHVELIGAQSGTSGTGVALLADWLAERWRDTALILIAGKSGAGVLERALRDRGVSQKAVRVATAPDYFTSCAMLLDGLLDGSVTHLATEGQAALDASVAVSDKKTRSLDGAWGWMATTPDGDETPTEAISLANYAARTTKRKPGRATRGRVMA